MDRNGQIVLYSVDILHASGDVNINGYTKAYTETLWNNLKPNEQVHWAYEAYIPVSANVKKAEQQWKKEKVADQSVCWHKWFHCFTAFVRTPAYTICVGCNKSIATWKQCNLADALLLISCWLVLKTMTYLWQIGIQLVSGLLADSWPRNLFF